MVQRHQEIENATAGFKIALNRKLTERKENDTNGN